MLLDFSLFTSWIEDRLRAAVQLEIEDQTLSGNGTPPNLRGILATAGIGAAGPPAAGQTAADTIAAGLSMLEETDESGATAIVLNPADYWVMRGVREGTGATAGGYLYGSPADAGPSTLWGVPLVRSTGIPEGTALVGDFRQATLAVREDTTVAWADAHLRLVHEEPGRRQGRGQGCLRRAAPRRIRAGRSRRVTPARRTISPVTSSSVGTRQPPAPPARGGRQLEASAPHVSGLQPHRLAGAARRG